MLKLSRLPQGWRVETERQVFWRVPSRGRRARWERYDKALPALRRQSPNACYAGLATELQALWLELATTLPPE